MSSMRLIFVTALVFIGSMTAHAAPTDEIDSSEAVETKLKKRQPNWLPKTLNAFPNGSPETVIFYEPDDNSDLYFPVKSMTFYPNGRVKSEADLMVIGKNDPLAAEFQTTVIPHGRVWHGTIQMEASKKSPFIIKASCKDLCVLSIPTGKYMNHVFINLMSSKWTNRKPK